MELIVASKHHVCDLFPALDVSGREHLVVIAKASWRFPGPSQRARPIVPAPLVVADEYYGAPGESPMRYGTDYVRFKPRCDVLFDAFAHSPNFKPTPELDVAVRVGDWEKAIHVVGPRVWKDDLTADEPVPFVEMPLHYGCAFGGARPYEQDGENLVETLVANPSGAGWGGERTKQSLKGEALPNLEYPQDPVRAPDGEHRPAALSAIGSHWLPRRQYAGTYDDAWRRDVAPFLPEDFDDRFFQCAPEDQQIDYPRGREEVRFHNMLLERPDYGFRLPDLSGMKVRILRTDYSAEALDAVVDTLYFEPERERFSVVWRASTPIHRRIQEFDTVAVGAVDPKWWRARSLGADGGGCVGCSEREAA